MKKQILPNKLRFVYWRRPSPEVKEPDPPNSDFPHNWRGRTDVLHIDIKIPSEHYLNMKRYDAEYQIFHYNRYRKRIVVSTQVMSEKSRVCFANVASLQTTISIYFQHNHM